MKTAAIQISPPAQSGVDSSRRQRAEERMRRLDEATLNALRQAELAREKKERDEQRLRETPPPYDAAMKAM